MELYGHFFDSFPFHKQIVTYTPSPSSTLPPKNMYLNRTFTIEWTETLLITGTMTVTMTVDGSEVAIVGKFENLDSKEIYLYNDSTDVSMWDIPKEVISEVINNSFWRMLDEFHEWNGTTRKHKGTAAAKGKAEAEKCYQQLLAAVATTTISAASE